MDTGCLGGGWCEVLDSPVDDKATVGAQKPLDDVHKARASGADGGVEERLECLV